MTTKNQGFTNEEIIEQVKNMTALQLKELVSAIETAFGVTAASQESQEEAAKPTTVSFILKEIGISKVKVIKAIGEALGKGLLDSKKIADAVLEKPQIIMANIDGAKAKELQEKFTEAGAVTEIK